MLKNRHLLILSALVLLFFLPVILSPYIWGFRDFHRYVHPLKYFAKESIMSGVIPLWNPYLAGGMPFLANLQSCIFYPPSILIYLLPYYAGLKAYIIFHFILSILSSYFLAKELGLDKIGSFIVAVTYTFSGWLVSAIDIPIILSGSSWVPLVLLFLIRTQLSFSYTILCGLSLSLCFLSGEPSIFYLSVLLVIFFSIYTGIGIRRPVLVILIAISISLFQILPFLEFVSYSERMHAQYSEVVSWSFQAYELFGLIIPSACGSMVKEPTPILWFGQEWLKSSYLGIIPFLLATTAILWPKKERVVSFFSAVFLISVLISFGETTPLYKFLYSHLPFFGLMRYPVKCIFLASLSLSILAGFSVQHILSKQKGFIRLFILMVILLAVGFFFFLLKKEAFFFLSDIHPSKILIWFQDVARNGYIVLLIAFSSVIAIICFWLSLIKRNTLGLILGGIIIIDLFYFGKSLNPLVNQVVYEKKEVIRILEKEKGMFRIMLSPKTNQFFTRLRGVTLEDALKKSHRFIIPNLGMVFSLFDAGAYDSIYIADYFLLKKHIASVSLDTCQKVLSMMNIRYIISKEEITEPGISLIYSEGDLKLYENPNVLERAFFVETKKVIEEKKDVLEYIFSKSFDPAKEVVLEEEPEKFQIANCKMQNEKAECRIIKYEPNKVVIDVDAPGDGFLFLSDTYYPGWKAYIDGKKTKIYRANYCFRAVRLSKGHHLIEMRFLPKSFVVGLVGGFISLIFIAVAFYKRSAINFFSY
ncbi:YfhO family protein [bacterium]|nr:YfhO family protein [bacterium]